MNSSEFQYRSQDHPQSLSPEKEATIHEIALFPKPHTQTHSVPLGTILVKLQDLWFRDFMSQHLL